MQSAIEAATLITANQFIGVGAGASVAHLVNHIAADSNLFATLTFTSASFTTTSLLREKGGNVLPPAYCKSLAFYFDGCDQFDNDLSALKSGGGIHTTEKILASMANEFVLLGDAAKMVNALEARYPLVVEVIPSALAVVTERLGYFYPDAVFQVRNSSNKDGVVVTEYGNYLLDITFSRFPDLGGLNRTIKMMPGVTDHSLFYRMAAKAIIAGPDGIAVVTPACQK